MMTTKHRVIFSAFLAVLLLAGCGGDPAARELDARERMARALATALPPELARAPLRVIANPFIKKPGVSPDAERYHQAVLRGLSAGLGRELREDEIVYPELRPGAWEQPERFLLGKSLRTPLTLLMTPDAFDRLSAAYPDTRLFISIVGVPEGLLKSAIVTDSRAPVLALYLPDFHAAPDAKGWRGAFERGRIAAAVLEQMGYPDGRLIRGPADAASYWSSAR